MMVGTTSNHCTIFYKNKTQNPILLIQYSIQRNQLPLSFMQGKGKEQTDVQFVEKFGFHTVTCCGYLPQVSSADCFPLCISTYSALENCKTCIPILSVPSPICAAMPPECTLHLGGRQAEFWRSLAIKGIFVLLLGGNPPGPERVYLNLH